MRWLTDIEMAWALGCCLVMAAVISVAGGPWAIMVWYAILLLVCHEFVRPMLTKPKKGRE